MSAVLGLVGWLAVTFGAAAVGARHLPGPWYATLRKPTWTPPDVVFAPVWSVLYFLMAVAAWRVWRAAGFGGTPAALGAFLVQLALNAAWSWLFFGRRRIGAALADVAGLWLAVLAVTALFWRHDVAAGALMLPYLAWVAFATALNAAIWRLNARR